MGGLLQINDTWLRYIKFINCTDFDSATNNGYYAVQGDYNSPSINELGLKDWGTLLVFGEIKTQIYIPANISAVMFIRRLLTPGWTKWLKFTGTLLTI